MQFNHTNVELSATFDVSNLVSTAGLVPVIRRAGRAGLTELAGKHPTVPTHKGANAGGKVASVVTGILAGAESIEDMRLLRHDGMRHLFNHVSTPSTLGSFLRFFEFGHVRQLDAVASRFLTRESGELLAECEGHAFVDIDDTIIEVEGYLK